MKVTDDLLDELSNILIKIYGRVYDIDRVCFYRGNVGLYDGSEFVLFLSKGYILDKFNIDLGNSAKNIDNLDLFKLIKQEKLSRVKLSGVI